MLLEERIEEFSHVFVPNRLYFTSLDKSPEYLNALNGERLLYERKQRAISNVGNKPISRQGPLSRTNSRSGARQNSASYSSKKLSSAKKTNPNNHLISEYYYLTVDDKFVYDPFFEDFGPINLGQTYLFSKLLDYILSEPLLENKKIMVVSSTDQKARTNGAFLTCAYMVIRKGESPESAFKPFMHAYPPFLPFRDASQAVSTFNLTILDCLRGLTKAISCKFFNFDEFNVEEYLFFEKVENGDLNWIVPGKFLAVKSPANKRITQGGYYHLTPEDYTPLFKKWNIKTVVRFNKASTYDRNKFVNAGINHFDLYYQDGGLPDEQIIKKFFQIVEELTEKSGGIAIHCKAGLGRTGTLIGMALMKFWRFTAHEAIAWMRICRPGSVIGIQQHFLLKLQERMWKAGEQYFKKLYMANQIDLSYFKPIPEIKEEMKEFIEYLKQKTSNPKNVSNFNTISDSQPQQQHNPMMIVRSGSRNVNQRPPLHPNSYQQQNYEEQRPKDEPQIENIEEYDQEIEQNPKNENPEATSDLLEGDDSSPSQGNYLLLRKSKNKTHPQKQNQNPESKSKAPTNNDETASNYNNVGLSRSNPVISSTPSSFTTASTLLATNNYNNYSTTPTNSQKPLQFEANDHNRRDSLDIQKDEELMEAVFGQNQNPQQEIANKTPQNSNNNTYNADNSTAGLSGRLTSSLGPKQETGFKGKHNKKTNPVISATPSSVTTPQSKNLATIRYIATTTTGNEEVYGASNSNFGVISSSASPASLAIAKNNSNELTPASKYMQMLKKKATQLSEQLRNERETGKPNSSFIITATAKKTTPTTPLSSSISFASPFSSPNDSQKVSKTPKNAPLILPSALRTSNNNLNSMKRPVTPKTPQTSTPTRNSLAPTPPTAQGTLLVSLDKEAERRKTISSFSRRTSLTQNGLINQNAPGPSIANAQTQKEKKKSSKGGKKKLVLNNIF